jgi:hypothetical protein
MADKRGSSMHQHNPVAAPQQKLFPQAMQCFTELAGMTFIYSSSENANAKPRRYEKRREEETHLIECFAPSRSA